MKVLKNYKSSIILLIAMIIGSLIGIIFKESIVYLTPVSDTFINLLYCLIVPLIFVSTVTALGRMTDLSKLGKMLIVMLVVFIVTGVFAALFMAAIVTIFDPTKGFNLAMTEVVDTSKSSMNFLAMFTTNDFYLLFSRRNLMALVVFALGFGVSVSTMRDKGRDLYTVFEQLEVVIMKLIGYVMKLAPIGIGSLFAVLAATYGADIVGPLSRSIIVYTFAALVYYFGANSLFAYIGGGLEGVKRMWKSIIPPTLTALGTCSSAATIPLTMVACNECDIPEEISSLTVPLGTNLQKDGAVLIQILKIAFMCTIYGMNFLDPVIIGKAIFVSVLASSVMGAIPSGGFVGELFIISVFGFPPESIPIMVLIGTITDAPATAINATGKIGISMIISRIMLGKEWIKTKVTKTPIGD